MKKRVLTVFLALVLCMGLGVPAFAATPVTENDITLSDVVITDQYKKFSDDPDVPMGCYSLGMIRLATDTEHPEYRAVGFYIVPDDAVITFHLSAGHTGAQVFAVTLEEDEPQDGVKAYTVHTSGSVSTGPLMQYTITIDKELLDTRSSKWDTPTYDLLACRVDNGEYVWVMFESKTDALGEPLTPTQPAAPAFTDVPDGQWYADAVGWAVENEITNGTGDGKFSPGQDCTQEQILTFLYRAARGGSTAASAADMAAAIDWAREKGMIDDSFNGKTPCTRATAVSYIWQALGREDAAAGGFTDVPADADYAYAVAWAVENGVTNGYGDTFRPDEVCTRGQIATFLHRAYVPSARLK